VEANRACDGVMHSLFQTTYYVGNEVFLLHKFLGMCSLLVKIKVNMTEKLYHDEKSCGEIYFTFHPWFRKKYWIGFETLDFLVL
jgi:hypothetical protein